MSRDQKAPTGPMPGAFAKLSGAFLLAGIAASIAVKSLWPLILFAVAIYFCLLSANTIERKYPGRTPRDGA